MGSLLLFLDMYSPQSIWDLLRPHHGECSLRYARMAPVGNVFANVGSPGLGHGCGVEMCWAGNLETGRHFSVGFRWVFWWVFRSSDVTFLKIFSRHVELSWNRVFPNINQPAIKGYPHLWKPPCIEFIVLLLESPYGEFGGTSRGWWNSGLPGYCELCLGSPADVVDGAGWCVRNIGETR